MLTSLQILPISALTAGAGAERRRPMQLASKSAQATAPALRSARRSARVATTRAVKVGQEKAGKGPQGKNKCALRWRLPLFAFRSKRCWLGLLSRRPRRARSRVQQGCHPEGQCAHQGGWPRLRVQAWPEERQDARRGEGPGSPLSSPVNLCFFLPYLFSPSFRRSTRLVCPPQLPADQLEPLHK